MIQPKLLYASIAGIAFLCVSITSSCKQKKDSTLTLVASAEQMQARAGDLVQAILEKNDSSLRLAQPSLTKLIYTKNEGTTLWSQNESWKPAADSLFRLVGGARLLGLFPEDYHYQELLATRERFTADTLSGNDKRDPELWAKADIFLTDAFTQLIKDVKFGKLPNDSISLNKDSVLADEFFLNAIRLTSQPDSISLLIHSLEPSHRGYLALKAGIQKFLDSADFREHTYVPSPAADSMAFKKALQRRLFEEGYLRNDSTLCDSAQLAEAVKKFQKAKNITVDGKAGEGTIRMLNLSDREKFIHIAISMDKYKKLPMSMPEKYIWVNTSSNTMEVVEKGLVKFSSRVITGKVKTKTPLLNSAISALITYPQWVPPPSIITKEILPAVKKNPAYLAKKGFSLIDADGEEVDPFTVDWSKYNKSIPYKVVQGSGDANALGIIKFFFDNKYSVYLHDTNQRYLFANAMRNLSHGCVRVQEWQQLAWYILRNDSLATGGSYSKMDSVKTWLKNKEKRQLALKARLPVFIRYMTCEGRNGSILFFDDVYGTDKFLREKYYASK